MQCFVSLLSIKNGVKLIFLLLHTVVEYGYDSMQGVSFDTGSHFPYITGHRRSHV